MAGPLKKIELDIEKLVWATRGLRSIEEWGLWAESFVRSLSLEDVTINQLAGDLIRKERRKRDADKKLTGVHAEKFLKFWEYYPKRNGKKVGKQTAGRIFKKIPAEELDRVIRNAINYGKTTDLPKDPERFLKNDFWKDWDQPGWKPKEQKTESGPGIEYV